MGPLGRARPWARNITRLQPQIRRPAFSKITRPKTTMAARHHPPLASASSTANLLSQTLASVTNIKLSELTKQRNDFETKKTELLRTVENETDQLRKLQLLVGSQICDGELKTKARSFLELAKVDPSVSTEAMKTWQGDLEEDFRIRSEKLKYAGLYGELVNEWLVGEKTGSPRQYDRMRESEREQLREQRRTWESYAFQPRKTNTSAIKDFLEKLFNEGPIVQEAYKGIVKSTRDFEVSLAEEKLDDRSMRWILEGMLGMDPNLFTSEKREILNTFLHNDAALVELADVLNMRLAALDTLDWHPEAIQIEQRRQLSGKYRFFQDEELLQSILVHYIGVEWSVHFKKTLRDFRSTDWVWKRSSKPIETNDLQRREDFLGIDYENNRNSVEDSREAHFLEGIFLEQLQTSRTPQSDAYNSESDTKLEKTPTQQTVHHLLHILAAEIILKMKQGGKLSVVRSDFRWFGPSLPHSTIFTVLSFLGVSERWVNTFRRILEAPIKFVEDGPEGKVQIRRRGIPIGGPLGVMLGEIPLFCLDFAFNQFTNGTRLYRLHDDIWFWGEQETCREGWKVVSSFTDLMGLEFNEEKTGSVTVGDTNAGLPQGDVKWGFLKLDSATGRFVIDREGVDRHVEHLVGQLASSKSVFDWIQVWNIYGVRFFGNNFGTPADAFGQAHVDAMVDTFAYIQRKAFSSSGGSVTSTMKEMIHQRFGIEDIPDGYLYFPVSDGGLEVKNPIAELLLIRDRVAEDPAGLIQSALNKDKHSYSHAKSRYENNTAMRSRDRARGVRSGGSHEPFMSLDEFTKYREQTSGPLGDAYRDLTVVRSIKALGSYYENYHVVQLYSSEMQKQFGSQNIVPKGMLPTGMVEMFRKSRFQWKE